MTKESGQTPNKLTNVSKELAREAIALWRLAVTVASAMAGYILIPQHNSAYKAVGAVLVLNAAWLAVVHYTKKA